eukprot:6383915-Pyramimonas_sp.AAC.1
MHAYIHTTKHTYIHTYRPVPELWLGLGVRNLLRHRSLLGALVSQLVYVAARSWELWCEELLASPIALYLVSAGLLGGPIRALKRLMGIAGVCAERP